MNNLKDTQTQNQLKPRNSVKFVSHEELFDERKKFKKGHPKIGGSKKGSSFSLLSILKRELQKIPPELKGKERKMYAEILIKKQLHKATVEGDEQSIKLIWNYVEGTPQESLDLTSGGEKIVENYEVDNSEIKNLISQFGKELKKALSNKQ